MTIQSPSENLRTREIHLYGHYRYRNGELFAVLKGLEIPIKEFYQIYPLADKVRIDKGKGGNIGSAAL